MRETRTSGSEGGGAELNRLSLPLSAVRRHPPRARCLGAFTTITTFSPFMLIALLLGFEMLHAPTGDSRYPNTANHEHHSDDHA